MTGPSSATTFDSKLFLANVSQRPGVYRMIGADGGKVMTGESATLSR